MEVSMSAPGQGDVRDLAEQLVLGLAESCTHNELDAVGPELGLAMPSQGSQSTYTLTKRQRVQQAFDLLNAEEYPELLARFLHRGLPPDLRNQVQDSLWAGERWPELTERVRRDVADALERVAPIWQDADGLMDLLSSLWVLGDEISRWTGQSLAREIERHVIRNPDDWTVLELFRQIGALGSSDRRFALLIQGLLSGSTNPDEGRQRVLVDAVSPALARAGLKIIETGSRRGYPEFTIVRTGTRVRPPQLILFASIGAKPDLRLSEVLDQEVESLDAEDVVLRYDRPISEQGLSWAEVQQWWAERKALSPDDAKLNLWSRLLASIPTSSPPQLALFKEYHQLYGRRPEFLALLPEVWVHWDPVTKARRGDHAMLSQRMDFLMLAPGHRRIVLEVDGIQHYSKNGKPSAAAYAETTRADRDLRLSSYEVYRFSGYELSDQRARPTVSEFFSRLLNP